MVSLLTLLAGILKTHDIQLSEWKPKSWDASNVDKSLPELVTYAEHNAEAAISRGLLKRVANNLPDSVALMQVQKFQARLADRGLVKTVA